MNIDLSNLPSHVHINAGASAEYALPSYADSGNAWSVIVLTNGGAAEVFIETRLPPAAPPTLGERGTQEPPPLAMAQERLVIRGLRAGHMTCRLILSRSFGERVVAATHELSIEVMEAK
jgi:hypothetical protein